MATEPKISPWRRPSRWIPLLLLLFAIVSFAAYRIASNSGVTRTLATLRGQGLPTSPTELDKWYTFVPAQENAALAFQDAYSLYNTPSKTNDPSEMKAFEMILGEPLPEPLAHAVELVVTDNREAIAQAHKAAKLRKSRYPINLTQGFATLLPHLAQLRSLSHLLKWEAVWQSAKGNKNDSLNAVRTGFAIAASLENEPLLISELVRIAILNQALIALERVLTEQELTEPELISFTNLLDRAQEQGKISMQRAMKGERAAAISAFKMDFKTFESLMAGSSGAEPWEILLFELRRSLGVNDQDMAYYLARMADYDTALQQDYPAMLQQTKTITDRFQQDFGKSRIRFMISGMILPSLEKGTERAAISAAQLRCARMALAIERYRLKNGTLPSLDVLVPDFLETIPLDPVSNEPIYYEKLRVGFRLTCEAATELKNKGKKNSEPEVAFTVLR